MQQPAPILILLASMSSACQAEPEQATAPAVAVSAPTEKEAPNAPSLKPAFAGQTRAPTMRAAVSFAVEEITDDLDEPWALEFLPDGRMLVTEKSGAFRLVGRDGKISDKGTGLPPVDHEAQGGLLDVALDPDFQTNRIVYWTYSEPRKGGNGTAVARGRLASGARPDVSEVKVLFRQMPTFESDLHFGSRIAFVPDGTMFVSLGERSEMEARMQSRNLDSHFGKVIRLNRDGSVPADNPFVGRAGALPEIWTIGHRNVQGIAVHPDTNAVWTIEHGPRGGDELNRPVKGKDYGWPTITYGIEYGGDPIGKSQTAGPGMEQPVYYWDPVIAPSSLLFYTGEMFPAWKGSAFIGGMNGKLVRLTMKGESVAGEEWLLTDRGERYRDVRQGPDGALYLVTDEGKLLRVAVKG